MSEDESNRLRGLIRCVAIALLILAPVVQAAEAPQSEDPAALERKGLELLDAKDYLAAAKLLAIGVEHGRAMSQWALSTQYFYGLGVPKDERKALELATASAEQGFADAQTWLGWVYLAGKGAPDYAAARKWLTAASQQGQSRAIAMLADLYGRGLGVAADPKMAVRLARRAAELGDSDAIHQLAGVLLYGPQDERDPKLAVHFLRRAATDGNARAAYRLSRLLLAGVHVPRDIEQAAHWMSRAAEGKEPLASLWLSELYAKGLGVPRNTSESQRLRQRALATANVPVKNLFAWELAVSEDERLRNGPLAVEIMRALLEDPAMRRPTYIDTLAAAYAEAGDLPAAMAAQQDAIAAFTTENSTPASRESMQRRLELYRAGRAYHEVTQ